MSIKKIVCAAAAVLCVGFTAASAANAITHPNALGLRLGGGSLFEAELNYQKGLNANRLELGASWGFHNYDGGVWYDGRGVRRYYWKENKTHLGVIGFYQWHFGIPIPNTRGLNWYIGPGAGVKFWSRNLKYYDNSSSESDGGIDINAGGQIGIEYDFNAMNVPLIVSLDLRGMIKLLNGLDDWYHAGLGVRYTF